MTDFEKFVRESNRIEGITRDPTKVEVIATKAFVHLPTVRVDDLVDLVGVYQPGAHLRTREGMNVYVGDHIPPPGGPRIQLLLTMILDAAHEGEHPYDTHLSFEALHPFLDGNGRSGRALWAWQMTRQGIPFGRIGFLHSWYYQSLSRSQVRP